MFFKYEKNVKYVFSNTAPSYPTNQIRVTITNYQCLHGSVIQFNKMRHKFTSDSRSTLPRNLLHSIWQNVTKRHSSLTVQNSKMHSHHKRRCLK